MASTLRDLDPNQRPTLTVEEAATVLGIARGTAYQAVKRGELPVLRIGRRMLVPTAALRRLLEHPHDHPENA